MRTLRWLALSLFLLLPLASVRAQENPPEGPGQDAGESMEETMAQMKAMFTAMIDFVGDERLSEEEMKTVVEHAKAMDELYDDEADDELQKKLDLHYEKTGKYDLRIVLDDARFKELVAELDIDGRRFLKLFLRATLLETRTGMKQQIEEQEKSLPEQRKQAEEMRPQLGDEAADQMLKTLDEAAKAIATWKELLAKIPEATDEEKAAFEKHGAELGKILNGDDDEDMDEPGEPGGDDEAGEEDGED